MAATSSTSNNQANNTATAPNPTSSDPIGDEATIKLSDNQNPAPRAAANTDNRQNIVNDLLDGTNTTATAKSANNNNTSSKDGFTNYVVVSGDTLYSIAKRFAVPAEKIKQIIKWLIIM